MAGWMSLNRKVAFAAAICFLAAPLSYAQCSNALTPTNSIKTSVASGYAAAVVATGLTKPRSVEIDSAGSLLVLEQGKGLSSHVLQDDGGACVSIKSSKFLIQDTNLTHGLALSPDGKTVYASSSDAVYSWDYDAAAKTVGSNRETLVFGMANEDHVTRTLLYPRQVDGMLVVSRGSGSNLDYGATSITTGISTVKAFNLSGIPQDGYNYSTSGMMLGWGLRNEVGVGEHPTTGGIWGVENSVDQLSRSGEDVHSDNPGEELNFLGYLNGTKSANQGTNFGYPYCLAAWVPADLPNNANIKVGTQFASAVSNDSMCANMTAPRLTFQAHMAPIDIKFNNSGNEAWISFRGSWNREDPVGYKLAMVPFANGEPKDEPTSNTSALTIFSNEDDSVCPDKCFRPAGLTFDPNGRVFMSSDASGEIYVVMKNAGASNGTQGTGGSTGSGDSGSGSGSGGSSAAARIGLERWWFGMLGFLVTLCLFS